MIRAATAACLAGVAACASALAHDVERPIAREVVRLQGFVGKGPSPATSPSGQAGEASATEPRATTLVMHGSDNPFSVTDYQVFGTLALQEGDASTPSPRIVLQGDRAPLVKIAEARADQRVTILAERRPGSSELFLLTLDLCPP